MRRKLALTGLVVFVVGVVVLIVGVLGTEGALHPVSGFHQLAPGEYVSQELNLTASATVTLRNPPTTMGLVTAQNLSVVNSTNLATTGVRALGTTSGTVAYLVSAGSYYVVYFGTSAPSTLVIYLYTGQAAAYGLATLAGLAMAVAGGIVGLVGVFTRPKPPANPQPPTVP